MNHSNSMTTELSRYRDMHQALLRRLDERATAIDAHESKMRQSLELCAAERRKIERERQVVRDAEAIYTRELESGLPAPLLFPDMPVTLSPDAVQGEETPKILRARIGPQRYLMLTALREVGGSLLPQDIAARTKLSIRRVRDQMADDHHLGVVAVDPPNTGAYCLTDLGRDLLERNEFYKKSHNEPLPSPTEPLSEDDLEETDSEDATEEGVSG